MRSHPTVHIRHGDLEAEIDEELAPLIREMWAAGVETKDSCQDVGEGVRMLAAGLPNQDLARQYDGRASIGFVDPVPLLAFYECLANSGPRDAFYERMVHWAAPGAWRPVAGVDDWGLEEGDELAPDGTPLSRFDAVRIVLGFPRSDIAEMTLRMQRHNAGKTVALGLPDWSSVSVVEGADGEENGSELGIR